jgi:hypothetical protein
MFTKDLGTYKLRKFRKMLGVLKVDLNLWGMLRIQAQLIKFH